MRTKSSGKEKASKDDTKYKISEKEIENHILLALEACGIFSWKNQTKGLWDPTKKIYRKPKNRFHIKGASDIFAIIEGKLVAIEVKTKQGQVSPDQRIFIARVNNEGGVAFIARDVQSCLQELLKHFPDHFKMIQYYNQLKN